MLAQLVAVLSRPDRIAPLALSTLLLALLPGLRATAEAQVEVSEENSVNIESSEEDAEFAPDDPYPELPDGSVSPEPDPEEQGPAELSPEELAEALRRTPRSTREEPLIMPEAERIRGQVIGRVRAIDGAELLIELEREIVLPTGSMLELVSCRAWVITVAGRQLRAETEINGRARVGEPVRDGARMEGASISPPLASGVLELSARLRVSLPIERLGFIALHDLRASYLFEPGIRVGVEVAPVAFGVTDARNPAALVAHLFVTYASRWVEVGIGLGYSTRQVSYARPWDPDPTLSTNPFDYSLFSFQQRLRLGNEDGFSIGARVAETYAEGESWEIGDISGDLRIPLGRDAWLYAAGGGGRSGAFYGEGGVRLLLERSGEMGSFFLLLTGGVVAVVEPSEDHLGPSLGVGFDWRLR